MRITYANNRIERLCNDENQMEKEFNHNKELIDGLQALMILLEKLDNIFDIMKFVPGYNLEKVTGSKNNAYSIRIIPKKRKSPYRMYLIPYSEGIEINIQKIDAHEYKNL